MTFQPGSRPRPTWLRPRGVKLLGQLRGSLSNSASPIHTRSKQPHLSTLAPTHRIKHLFCVTNSQINHKTSGDRGYYEKQCGQTDIRTSSLTINSAHTKTCTRVLFTTFNNRHGQQILEHMGIQVKYGVHLFVCGRFVGERRVTFLPQELPRSEKGKWRRQ